ncbi:MAG TPA: hypothetical protein VF766_01720 [Pyrinomonadaceae bacterium]
MLTLLLHPEIGDEPGSGLVFVLILAGYVVVGVGVLYLAIKLIRAFFLRGKSR